MVMALDSSQVDLSPLRAAACIFLALEAALGAGWWILMAGSATARAALIPPEVPAAVWFAIAPADVVLYVVAAAASAWGLARRRRWAVPVLLIHTGAALYAGLWCWSLAVSAQGPWLPAVLMATSMIALPLIARVAWKKAW
jgi:hypothetical protein